jgi:hypothetical protein
MIGNDPVRFGGGRRKRSFLATAPTAYPTRRGLKSGGRGRTFSRPPRGPKPNIHVMSRKVTEHLDYIGLASNMTPVGNFVFRSGDTKFP